MRGNTSDVDWLRALTSSAGRRALREVIQSITGTVALRRNRADRIDDLLSIAERGVEAVERIAACMEKASPHVRKRRRAAAKAKRRSG
jgi:hypothetical protein